MLGDALVLATSLLTDRQSYKRVEIDSPAVIRPRELSRSQDELKAELRRATNRLWQQLHRYYPQMLAISRAADDRLIWDLLEAAPTPAVGKKISSLRVQRILKASRIRRFTADQVLSALKTAPLALAPGAAEAACEHVLLLLPQVKLLDEQLREVGNRIKNLLTALTEANAGTSMPPFDAGLMLSIPGVGPAVAAALLTEASRPIRRQYDALRAAGHLHARALRALADRLIGVLIALLKTQKPFERARRDGTFAKNPVIVASA